MTGSAKFFTVRQSPRKVFLWPVITVAGPISDRCNERNEGQVIAGNRTFLPADRPVRILPSPDAPDALYRPGVPRLGAADARLWSGVDGSRTFPVRGCSGPGVPTRSGGGDRAAFARGDLGCAERGFRWGTYGSPWIF